MPDNRMQRFTQRARRALGLAQEEAERMRHTDIDSGHLVIGLLKEDGGVAGRTLKQLGVKTDDMEQIMDQLRPSEERQPFDRLDLAPETRKIIELAVEEARRMGHHYIGTEHLLLALLRHNEGIAMNMLNELDISPDEIRKQVHRVLQDTPSVPSRPPTRPSSRPLEPTTLPFTPDAVRVLSVANEQAQRRDRTTISIEHLLLALVMEDEGIAGTVLKQLGVNASKLEEIIGSASNTSRRLRFKPLDLDPNAEDVVELASEEAKRTDDGTIGTEHLLLGFIGHYESSALYALHKLNISLEQIREEMQRHLDED